MQKIITRDYIVHLLRTNDKALGRALVALNKRQTQDEQYSEQTRYLNLRGFMPMHAKKGTGMARFFENKGFLTAKQLAWWRQVTPSGKPRIEKYVGQLLVVAEESGRQVT